MTDAAGAGRVSGEGAARTTRAAYRRFHRVTTRWSDNDAYGHVNNTLHYAFIDTAVNRLLVDVGLLDVSRSPAIGLVVETGCRYLASISYPDDVHVGMRVGHLGRSSVRYEVALFRNNEDEAAAVQPTS